MRIHRRAIDATDRLVAVHAGHGLIVRGPVHEARRRGGGQPRAREQPKQGARNAAADFVIQDMHRKKNIGTSLKSTAGFQPISRFIQPAQQANCFTSLNIRYGR